MDKYEWKRSQLTTNIITILDTNVFPTIRTNMATQCKQIYDLWLREYHTIIFSQNHFIKSKNI